MTREALEGAPHLGNVGRNFLFAKAQVLEDMAKSDSVS